MELDIRASHSLFTNASCPRQAVGDTYVPYQNGYKAAADDDGDDSDDDNDDGTVGSWTSQHGSGGGLKARQTSCCFRIILHQ